MWFRKKPIERDIDLFVTARKAITELSANGHKEVLEHFLDSTGIKDRSQITDYLVQSYIDKFDSEFLRMKARSTLNMFRKYDTILSMMERKPHYRQEKVDAVCKLRYENNLSFRQISKLMDADIRQVYRWYTYGHNRKAKLSTAR